jgi:hypothetical protein
LQRVCQLGENYSSNDIETTSYTTQRYFANYLHTLDRLLIESNNPGKFIFSDNDKIESAMSYCNLINAGDTHLNVMALSDSIAEKNENRLTSRQINQYKDYNRSVALAASVHLCSSDNF